MLSVVGNVIEIGCYRSLISPVHNYETKRQIMKYNITWPNTLAITIILLSIIVFQSCATKYTFSNSQVVPAAEGSVKVKKDNNNNYKNDLKVRRLANSRRLVPPREMYIVWMETEQNGTRNIGQLTTSSGLLSNILKSSLETVSTYKPTGFFITAEDNATAQNPEGQVVLRTRAK